MCKMSNGTWQRLVVSAIVGAAGCLAGCGAQDKPGESGRLSVFVSIPPQAFFVERIAGEHVDVHVLVAAGQSPHSFAPTIKQMTALGQAGAYFCVGVPFEQALIAKVAPTHPELRVIHTHTREEHGDAKHAYEHAGHDHGEIDPHTWLSPRLAGAQAKVICDALCQLAPDHAADFRRNLASLTADLAALDAELRQTLAPLRGRTLLAYHAAFGHFAEEYGLVQKAVETGGKSPGPRKIVELTAAAREEGVRVIFVQPQFSTRAAEAIASQIGGAVVPVDPLARDYIANLRRVGKTIAEGLATPNE